MCYIADTCHESLNFFWFLMVSFFPFSHSHFILLFALHFWCSTLSFLFLRSVFFVDLYPAVHDGFCYSFYSIKVLFSQFDVIGNHIDTKKRYNKSGILTVHKDCTMKDKTKMKRYILIN